MKKAVGTAMRHGAKGVRVQCAGRLGGAEMSRSSGTSRVRCLFTPSGPTSTTASEARTTFGRIGVKVWIYRGPFQDLYATARDAARLRREAALAAGETVGRGAEERFQLLADQAPKQPDRPGNGSPQDNRRNRSMRRQGAHQGSASAEPVPAGATGS